MNAIFRHFTVRLWSTALVSGLICVLLLPHWQRIAGMDWLPLPVLVVLLGCFLLTGWAMNRLGGAVIRRQVAEAAVYERAGMSAEAQVAFERVRSLFDGFWLSPVARRRSAAWITMRLARFYLTQTKPAQEGQAMVISYLYSHPQDEAVAGGWLETMLQRDTHSRQEQELAMRIGLALESNEKIQRMLMQFYLADRRADFDAMQNYRRVWQHTTAMPESMIRELARILLNETNIDEWALQVYLKAYALGESGCLEGIAAGVQFLRPNADNREHLDAARQILSGLDEPRRRKLTWKFEPAEEIPFGEKHFEEKPSEQMPIEKMPFAGMSPEEMADEEMSEPLTTRKGLESIAATGRSVACLGASLLTSLDKVLMALGRQSRTLFQLWGQSPQARRATLFVAIVGVTGVMAVAGWRWIAALPEKPPVSQTAAQPKPTPSTDPFTIQVAAFLKPEDAQRLVDRLKQQTIDAFYTKAVSANRAWFQVKASHFATRDQAQKYGETLKSKGLIDDFYVSNYSQ